MSDAGHNAVFLSYAREDATAARRIAEALRAAGVEVWFDENELRGGDQWDAKIRKQIDACALFVPIISRHTQERSKGYFRLEWKLAVEQTHLLADGVPFIAPVVIDDTIESRALVPAEFMRVQWTRLPAALPTPQLVEQVKRLLDRRTAPTGETEAPIAARRATADAPAARLRAPFAISAAVGAVAAIAAIIWFGASKIPLEPASAKVVARTPDSTTPARAVAGTSDAAVSEKSVAVLAFANLSGDREAEFFSEGISEDLLNLLSKIPGLKVSARTSAFYFKGKQSSVQEIAEKLGVAYIVEGSVQKFESRVRISAKLIKASDGYQIWSDKFDRELKDMFALQDEIAALIAENLQVKLGGAARMARSVNPEAHRLLLEGRHFWNLRTEEAFARAEEVYRRALRLDSGFAEAHAGIADVYAVRGWYRALAGDPAMTGDFVKATSEAQRARELNPMLAEPYACLAAVCYNERKFAESERYFAQAFALNPNYATAYHWRGHLLGTVGRLDAALVELERALNLDPLSFIILWTYSSHLNNAGRHEDALRIAERGLRINPGFVPLQGERAGALAGLNRYDEAIAAARTVTGNPAAAPRFYADSICVYVLRASGAESEAAQYAGTLLATLPAASHHRALINAALGRGAEILHLLETARPSTLTRLAYHPMWDSLRGDSRFQQLLVKLGCTEEYQRARETLARMQKEQEAKRPSDTNSRNPKRSD